MPPLLIGLALLAVCALLLPFVARWESSWEHKPLTPYDDEDDSAGGPGA